MYFDIKTTIITLTLYFVLLSDTCDARLAGFESGHSVKSVRAQLRRDFGERADCLVQRHKYTLPELRRM